MDTQVDYAAGMPLAILDEVPAIDPATPSPGMVSASEHQVDDTDNRYLKH
ncbi:hypothetical protein [Paraburkholderia aspalathi]|uniref:Uncharacterized protein n=1 Tax=Paraburkholderia aspalathi TaxID=1324617 RepID=A0A1I7BDS1_9BURK|nr:hypothetical protein [Paraburkholderia aspalathi]SFT85307.1 hypothetical protein SAMN05192563_1004383 [Paraburkholderia aspalathi]